MSVSQENSSSWIRKVSSEFVKGVAVITTFMAVGFVGTSGYLNLKEEDPSAVLEDSFERDLGKLGEIPLLSTEGEALRLIIDLPEVRPVDGDDTTVHYTFSSMPVINFARVASDPSTGVEATAAVSSEPTTTVPFGPTPTTVVDQHTTDLGSLDGFIFRANLQPDDLAARGLTGEEIQPCDSNPDSLCSEAVNFNRSKRLRSLAVAAVARCLGDVEHPTGATAQIATAIRSRQKEIFTSNVVVWEPVALKSKIADDPSLSGITCTAETG